MRRRIIFVALPLAILLLFSTRAYGQDPDCVKTILDITGDTGSAAVDCGEWLASEGLDLKAGAKCLAGLALLGYDVGKYSANCFEGKTGPGGCPWWDLYCAAINVWRGPWGPGDWDFGFGGGSPCPGCPKLFGPGEEAKSARLKLCVDLLTSNDLDLNGYIDCTAKCQNVDVPQGDDLP